MRNLICLLPSKGEISLLSLENLRDPGVERVACGSQSPDCLVPRIPSSLVIPSLNPISLHCAVQMSSLPESLSWSPPAYRELFLPPYKSQPLSSSMCTRQTLIHQALMGAQFSLRVGIIFLSQTANCLKAATVGKQSSLFVVRSIAINFLMCIYFIRSNCRFLSRWHHAWHNGASILSSLHI